jgi:hypothetical protein
MLTLGCDLAQIGQLGNPAGDIFGDSQQDQIVGEVLSVNTRQREIELRTDDRRSQTVRYDNQTRVVYRDRDYSVSNLEPGDYVAVRVQTDRSGYSHTDLVRVRESVQDRGGTASRGGRSERLQGTVEYVDSRRGEFEIRDDYGRRVMVTLPYNPQNSDIDRLRGLRRGDHVRLQGQFLNPDRFELESFV